MPAWIRLGTWLLVVVNVGFGLYALAAPEGVAAMIGLTLDEPRAAGELRAVYGGLVGALGLMLALAVRRRDATVFAALALGFAGLAVGRAVSLPLDGWSWYTAGAGVFEGATAVFLGVASARLERDASAGRQALAEPISNDSPR